MLRTKDILDEKEYETMKAIYEEKEERGER